MKKYITSLIALSWLIALIFLMTNNIYVINITDL